MFVEDIQSISFKPIANGATTAPNFSLFSSFLFLVQLVKYLRILFCQPKGAEPVSVQYHIFQISLIIFTSPSSPVILI